MFAKRNKPAPPQESEADEASQTEQSRPDPRDEAIERLSRELSAERANLTAVREALDAATFKTEILEKSYAKQLADTRATLAAIEQKLADKEKLLASLDGGHEDALRTVNELRGELKAMTSERDELRRQIAKGGFKTQKDSSPHAPRTVSVEDTSGGTINALIANAGWAEQKSSDAVGGGHASAKVAQPDAPPEVMIAPELVFTKDRDDDEP